MAIKINGSTVIDDSQNWSGTAVAATKGGTGRSSYTTGDILYASNTTALSALADVATGNALISGGVGVAPSWGKIALTTHISGTLAVGNGGTGTTTLTQNNVILGNGTSAVQFVAPSTNGNVLTSNGTTWVSQAPAGGSTITDDTSTNTTQYIGMSRATSGTWSTAYVSSTKFYFNPSTGTAYATVFQSLSDAKEKENVQTVQNSIEIVKSLRGVEFNWKDNGNKSSGVIAQELEKVLPHLVSTGDQDKKSVNYDGIIAYLIEAVKELSDKVKSLESK